MTIETKRVDIRIPSGLLDKIEQYQKEEDIATRTGALLELVRLGLEYNQSKKKEI